MRNGKDTFANVLKNVLEQKNKKVLITHFADCVKFTSKEFFSWNGEKDEVGRRLLQVVGTDYYRNMVDKNYWVNYMKNGLNCLNYFAQENKDYKYDYVIIPDTRFENEIESFLDEVKYGNNYESVISIRMVRDIETDKNNAKHSSETALDGYKFDFIVTNNGTINDLESKAKLLLSVSSIYGGTQQCCVI